MTILEIRKKLRSGGREDIKEALKELEKIRFQKEKKKDLEDFFKEEIRDFEKIAGIQNKLAILSGLNSLMFKFGYENFDFCKNFILSLLENEDGRIRQQAICLGENLILDLTVGMGFFEKDSSKDFDKRSQLLINFYNDLLNLVQKYQHQYRGVYISDLKPGALKSVEILIANG